MAQGERRDERERRPATQDPPEVENGRAMARLVAVDRAGPELGAIRDLFLEYAESLAFNTCFGGLDEELAALPQGYAPPHGCLLLAQEGTEPAGCVGVRRVDRASCEMKRLYVRPPFRHGGLGRALAVAAIERARLLGYRRMLLDSLPTMLEARSLYASLGFIRCAPYYDNRALGSDCFERLL
jgi:GNAT superfamily N-acetyltransferase